MFKTDRSLVRKRCLQPIHCRELLGFWSCWYISQNWNFVHFDLAENTFDELQRSLVRNQPRLSPCVDNPTDPRLAGTPFEVWFRPVARWFCVHTPGAVVTQLASLCWPTTQCSLTSAVSFSCVQRDTWRKNDMDTRPTLAPIHGASGDIPGNFGEYRCKALVRTVEHVSFAFGTMNLAT